MVWYLVTALLVAGGLFYLSGQGSLAHLYETGKLWSRLGWPLVRTLMYITGGLLVGQLIEGMGWTAKLGVLAWPLIRQARLPKEAGAAYTAAFASGVTSNAMLFTAWQEGKLTRKELILSNILNAGLPAYFLHLPTTFFVVYALLHQVALIYFGLTLLAAFLRTLAVVVLGRFMFPADRPQAPQAAVRTREWRKVLADTGKKFFSRLQRLLLIILPVYLLVFILAEQGFFNWLGQAMADLVASKALPLETMSLVIFAVMAEFTSGFAAAGALLQSGSLSIPQVVIALLIGNMVATPVRALRHQLPNYMGIFAPGLGTKLLGLGQATRVASVLLVTLLYAWLT
ncbi:MAG: hypothetical protein KQJ78_02490 [Deltaproteobacteria bacterium]|nr:hypothetical protein [Deltaproteobacteria bacterium]